jgi:poly-gamma-glutamate synthesis protein (capsule biosynthesis protein)
MVRPLTLAFAGDVMLGRLVNESLAGGAYARPWGDALPLLRDVTAFFVNLECALTARTTRWPDGGVKPFYFRADPAAVATLVAGRVDFASVANNHIGDFGPDGLRDTLATLDRVGIAHAGAGEDRLSARAPALLTPAGTRIAVVAGADYPAEWAATATAPGINYIPISLAPEHFDEVKLMLAVAREQAELVVFSIHWGPNMRARPTPEFREFAHAVIDAGADIFWGHSAHVVHGMERRRDGLILYDTGDVIDDYAVDTRLRNDLSALFLVRVVPPVVQEVEVVPVRIEDLRVMLAHGADREWFAHRYAARCADVGAQLAVETGALRLAPAHHPATGSVL